MDKKMKAFCAVVFAIAFVASFAAVFAVADTEVSGEDATVITESKTYTDGEQFDLNTDYVLESNVVLTFKEGAILYMDMTKPFSIKGNSGSGFIFEEGAQVVMEFLSEEEFNEIEEYTSIVMEGKVTYNVSIDITKTPMKVSMEMTIDNGTKATVNGVNYNFTKTSASITADVDMPTSAIASGTPLSEIKGSISGTVNVSSDGIKIGADGMDTISIDKIKLNASYDMKTPGSSGTDKITVSLKGDFDAGVSDKDVTIKATENFDISVGIQGLKDNIDWSKPETLKNVIPFINGTMSSSITVDSNADGAVVIKNANLSHSANFSNEQVKMSASISFDSIKIDGDAVDMTIDKTSYTEDITLELGSFMELLSGRNIVGTAIFMFAYIPDPTAGRTTIEDFFVSYLQPICPDGFAIRPYVHSAVASIPDESAGYVAMPFAYILFFFQLDQKNFETECAKIASTITETGPVSKFVAYTDKVSDLITSVVTGVDDYKHMSIDAKCSFVLGKISADGTTEQGTYAMTWDGFKANAGLTDNSISADAWFGGIEISADTKEYNVTASTPSFSADATLGSKSSVGCNIDGDLSVSYKGKAEVGAPNFDFAFKGIDYDFNISADDRTLEISLNDAIKSFELAFDDFNMTSGKISVSEKFTYDVGSYPDLFSLRNLDYLVEFIFSGYDPAMSEAAVRTVLNDIFYTAFPEPETEDYIEQIIASMDEPTLATVGGSCEYVLFVFNKENVNLEKLCSDVKAGIKNFDSIEGKIDYFEQVSQKIGAVMSGIDDYQSPSFTYNYSAAIGTIDATYRGQAITFYGAASSISIDDDMEIKTSFEGLDLSVSEEGYKVDLVLPSISSSSVISTDKITGSMTIKGDLIASFIDKDYEKDSFEISIEGIDTSEAFTIDENKVTIDTKESIGEVFLMFDGADDISSVFKASGASSKVSGELDVDIESVIEAIISGDISELNIEANLDSSVSIKGAFYTQSIPGDGDMKAAIDNCSVSGKFTYNQDGITTNGKMTVEGAYMMNEDRLIEIDNLTITADLANDTGTADLKGDLKAAMFEAGQAVRIVTAEDVAVSGNIVPADYDDEFAPSFTFEPTAVSTNLKFWDYGIVTDLGKVVMTDFKDGDYQFEAEEATVSGNYIEGGELKSINGYIKGIAIIPSNDGESVLKYKESSITYVQTDGAQADVTTVPDESRKAVKVDFKTSGTGIMYYSDTVNIDMLYYMILRGGYYEDFKTELTIAGDVPLVLNYINLEAQSIEGKAYVKDGSVILADDARIDVEFVGALLCVDCGKTGGPQLSIIALPGYDLDPNSYIGFTVDANNNVEPIYIGYVADLYAKSNGKTYNITIDGAKDTAQYGSVYSRAFTGGDAPLWLVDKDGNMCGYVLQDKFILYYDVVGDLELTSVFGTKVVPAEPGTIVKTDAEGFFVQNNGHSFIVQNKAGVRFNVDGAVPLETLKFSASETKYDGHKAFEIKGNYEARIDLPISTVDAFVYHVINDTAVPMVTDVYYDLENDQYYASIYASEYSVYYIEENNHDGGSGDNMIMYIAIAVVVIVLIAIIFFALSRKKKASA
jgi:hypothetical protein